MNTKYQTSAHLSENIYNNLSYSELLSTLNAVKLNLPFSPCECSFIYSVNNEIHACSISDIPKALNPTVVNYWAVDFTDYKNYVSVTVTHNSLSVSVSLPYDYLNSKIFTENTLKLCFSLLSSNPYHFNNTKQSKYYQIHSSQNKQWYKSGVFWTAFGAVSAAIFAVINIVLHFL